MQQLSQFREKSITDRRTIVKSAQCCYICLGCNHIAAECWSKVRCSINGCQGKYSRWLHFTAEKDSQQKRYQGTRPRSKNRVPKDPEANSMEGGHRQQRGPSKPDDHQNDVSACYYMSISRESRDEQCHKRERMGSRHEMDEPEGPSSKQFKHKGSETQ